MKKNRIFIFLMVLVCLFSFTALWAQDKKPEAKPEEAAKLDAKQMVDFSKQVELFSQLVSVGEEKKDSVVLMGAVRLLDSLPFDGIAKPGSEEKSGARYNRNDILKQAKEYAQGDAEVLAMVAKLQEVPQKTDVRYMHQGGHGGYGGHGWQHYGYHGGGYGPHHNRHRCSWFQVCGHHGCQWVCR